jgi:hypothetical protein
LGARSREFERERDLQARREPRIEDIVDRVPDSARAALLHVLLATELKHVLLKLGVILLFFFPWLAIQMVL